MTTAAELAGKPGTRLFDNAYFYAILGIVSACYAALRFTFNQEFDPTFFQKIYDFTAPIPFGKRVLIAVLAHPLVAGGLSLVRAFQFWEACSTFILLLGLYRVFELHVGKAWARVLAAGFAFVLPPVFLLKNPFPYLFPWDTPAMAFIVWGIYFLLRGAWGRTIVLLLFATANRESAILIPALFCALYVDRLPHAKFAGILLAFLAAYGIVSWLISLTLADNFTYYGSAPFASFHKYGKWRLFINLAWLGSSRLNGLVLVSTLGGLPVAFLVFIRQIPAHLKRFAPVALLYFAMLAFVGNLYESRIFGEIAAILYVPVALGGCRYASGAGAEFPGINLPGNGNFLRPYRAYLEIAAAVAILALWFAGCLALKAFPPP